MAEQGVSGCNEDAILPLCGGGIFVEKISLELATQTSKKIVLVPLVRVPAAVPPPNGTSSSEGDGDGDNDLPDGGVGPTKKKKTQIQPPAPQPRKKKKDNTPSSSGIGPPRAKRNRANTASRMLAKSTLKAGTSGGVGVSRERRRLIGPQGMGQILGCGTDGTPLKVGVGKDKEDKLERSVARASGITDCVADAGSGQFPCKRCHGEFYCSQGHLEANKERHEPLCKTKASLEVIVDNPIYDNWLQYGAKQLYELCLNFVLTWPSSTVQWFPEETTFGDADPHRTRHKLLLGTQTSGSEMNHLLICGLDTWSHSKYGGELQVIQRINHGKEVDRARMMPSNTNIIATRSSPGSDVLVFNLATFPQLPPDEHSVSPTLRLQGNTQEAQQAEGGSALCWSPHASDCGKLVSGSSNGEICLWDVNAGGDGSGITMSGEGASIHPLSRFQAHTALVEDVSWNYQVPHIFASGGDDKRVILWDVREPVPIHALDFAHEGDINSVAFSPLSEYYLATGGSDTVILIWDTRRFSNPLESISNPFKEGVYRVEWSPHNKTLLAGTGDDGQVALFDISTLRDKREEGRQEPDFIHCGHVSSVNDIGWCPQKEGMIASVASDNILQVWKPTYGLFHNLYSPVEEERRSVASQLLTEDNDGEGEDSELDVEN